MDSRLVQNPQMALKKEVDIFEKCCKFTVSKEIMDAGIYPYFRGIESAQDPEVIVGGKKMIMIGSNNYLGLSNHPKVKEAAMEAIETYGASCTGSRFLTGALQIHIHTEKPRHSKQTDPADLERILKGLPEEPAKLVVVDGVFSMAGDIARLPEIIP